VATTKAKAKGYMGTRVEPVQTEMGYTLKPIRGKEVREIKKILQDNFEELQGKLNQAEEQRVARQKELGSDVQLPPDNAAGMAVAELILEEAFDQVWTFLGEMCDVDLDEEPWTAHLDILESLVREDDFPNYVRKLWDLGQTFSSVIGTNASSDTAQENGS